MFIRVRTSEKLLALHMKSTPPLLAFDFSQIIITNYCYST